MTGSPRRAQPLHAVGAATRGKPVPSRSLSVCRPRPPRGEGTLGVPSASHRAAGAMDDPAAV